MKKLSDETERMVKNLDLVVMKEGKTKYAIYKKTGLEGSVKMLDYFLSLEEVSGWVQGYYIAKNEENQK